MNIFVHCPLKHKRSVSLSKSEEHSEFCSFNFSHLLPEEQNVPLAHWRWSAQSVPSDNPTHLPSTHLLDAQSLSFSQPSPSIEFPAKSLASHFIPSFFEGKYESIGHL